MLTVRSLIAPFLPPCALPPSWKWKVSIRLEDYNALCFRLFHSVPQCSGLFRSVPAAIPKRCKYLHVGLSKEIAMWKHMWRHVSGTGQLAKDVKKASRHFTNEQKLADGVSNLPMACTNLPMVGGSGAKLPHKNLSLRFFLQESEKNRFT